MTLHIDSQRFGMLVAVCPVGLDKHNKALWKCLCDCGRCTIKTASSLKSGKILSCSRSCGHIVDLSGMRFGKLVVVKMVG